MKHVGQICCRGILSVLFASQVLSSAVVAAEPTLPKILQNSSSDGQGLHYIHEWTAALSQAGKQTVLTADADHAFHILESTIQDLRFDRIFTDPLGMIIAPDARLFILHGYRSPQAFVIETNKAYLPAERLSQALDFSQGVTVSKQHNPLPGEKKAYGLDLHSEIRLGGISHKNFLLILSGLLKRMRPYHRESADDDGIFDELRRFLPKTMQMVERYVNIIPEYSQEVSNLHRWFRVTVKIQLQSAALARDYPAFSSYLSRLLDSLKPAVKIVVRGRDESVLLGIDFAGEERELRAHLLVENGRIVPVSKQGEMLFAASIDPASLSELQVQANVDLRAQLMGLRFSCEHIHLDMAFREQALPSLKATLISADKPDVSGSLGWVIPVWAIDAMIPGSIAGHAQRFFEGLIRARQGTFLTGIIHKDRRGYLLIADGESLLVDNNFLLLGLRTIQSYLWPGEEVRADVKLLSERYFSYLHHDISEMLLNSKT